MDIVEKIAIELPKWSMVKIISQKINAVDKDGKLIGWASVTLLCINKSIPINKNGRRGC